LFTNHIQLNDQLLKALLEVALLLDKTKKKTHTVGENSVLPTAIKMCEIVHGDKIVELLRLILASGDI
jgi:hypothetical protein